MARANSTLENAFVAWIKSVLGSTFTVYWDKQDFPNPTMPFAVLSFLSFGNIEDSTANRRNNPDKSTIILTHEILTISVDIFDDSGDYLNKIAKLKRSIFDDVIYNALNVAGLSFRSASNTTDLSSLQESSYDLRAQCDFTFAYAVGTTESDTGYISRVSGDVLDIPFDTNDYIGD